MATVFGVLLSVWEFYKGLPTIFHVLTWVVIAFCFGWVYRGCHGPIL